MSAEQEDLDAVDPERPATGIEEPPGRDPGDTRGGRDPHHVLNNPATDPDPTEWPDPYERRPDPRYPEGAEEGEVHTAEGALSTSEPHPDQDLQAPDSQPPQRDRLDD
jgi:hypothetical protein